MMQKRKATCVNRWLSKRNV